MTAQDLTVMLLGEKWRPAGLLLSIIALRGIFQVVEGSQDWLHLSRGAHQGEIVKLVVQVVAVVGGLPFGATGVAVAVVMTSLLIAVPSISYAEMVGEILQNVLPRTARSPTVLTFVHNHPDNFDEAVHRQK